MLCLRFKVLAQRQLRLLPFPMALPKEQVGSNRLVPAVEPKIRPMSLTPTGHRRLVTAGYQTRLYTNLYQGFNGTLGHRFFSSICTDWLYWDVATAVSSSMIRRLLRPLYPYLVKPLSVSSALTRDPLGKLCPVISMMGAINSADQRGQINWPHYRVIALTQSDLTTECEQNIPRFHISVYNFVTV